MGLVDGQQIGAAIAKKLHQARQRESFRGDIDEPQPPFGDGALGGEVLAGRIGGVQRPCRDAIGPQLAHLIVHKGDERRDDDGQALPHERRQLVAQRLAAARGHDRQHVFAREDGSQRILLSGPEGGIAIDARQRRPRLHEAVFDLGG